MGDLGTTWQGTGHLHVGVPGKQCVSLWGKLGESVRARVSEGEGEGEGAGDRCR